MIATDERPVRTGPNPLHGMLLAGGFPLFLGAALSDYAYFTSFHIQWATFSSWLIAGGLVFCGFALICALIGIFRPAGSRGLSVLYFVLLLVTWVLGFVNALVHARDAWAMMPTGLTLSVVVAVLAFAAVWIGFTSRKSGGYS
ncbi:DUF2231 domain-containing protein [Salinicola acroporae]|uniref:DUF2231 domain-containing protein n=1 Tax=Salinicola acroporae TaxID=1541440 RepID=A0ABT6I8U3_9GAMM|nr:DUF2231 domain-containing protein [Salinicola acroporae]MDH4574081.1 hypothetical protein [Salinicola acroporae]